MRTEAYQRERVLKKVAMAGPDKCWLWTGPTNTKGYGKAWYLNRYYSAHRLVLEFLGVVYDTPQYLHTCDVKRCCNPAHIIPGDNSINQRMAVQRGQKRGAKLTVEDVNNIRSLLGTIPQSVLALQYGVGRSAITNIKQGKTWQF